MENVEIIENLEGVQDEFLALVGRVYDQAVGYEEYGETTEFYGDCGEVLMTIRPDDEDPEKLVFMFGETGESYTYAVTPDAETADEDVTDLADE